MTPADMVDYVAADKPRQEQHIYHHTADSGPRLNVKAEKNSRGWNFEASCTGAESVEQALELLKRATNALQAQYGGGE